MRAAVVQFRRENGLSSLEYEERQLVHEQLKYLRNILTFAIQQSNVYDGVLTLTNEQSVSLENSQDATELHNKLKRKLDECKSTYYKVINYVAIRYRLVNREVLISTRRSIEVERGIDRMHEAGPSSRMDPAELAPPAQKRMKMSHHEEKEADEESPARNRQFEDVRELVNNERSKVCKIVSSLKTLEKFDEHIYSLLDQVQQGETPDGNKIAMIRRSLLNKQTDIKTFVDRIGVLKDISLATVSNAPNNSTSEKENEPDDKLEKHTRTCYLRKALKSERDRTKKLTTTLITLKAQIDVLRQDNIELEMQLRECNAEIAYLKKKDAVKKAASAKKEGDASSSEYLDDCDSDSFDPSTNTLIAVFKEIENSTTIGPKRLTTPVELTMTKKRLFLVMTRLVQANKKYHLHDKQLIRIKKELATLPHDNRDSHHNRRSNNQGAQGSMANAQAKQGETSTENRKNKVRDYIRKYAPERGLSYVFAAKLNEFNFRTKKFTKRRSKQKTRDLPTTSQSSSERQDVEYSSERDDTSISAYLSSREENTS